MLPYIATVSEQGLNEYAQASRSASSSLWLKPHKLYCFPPCRMVMEDRLRGKGWAIMLQHALLALCIITSRS